MIAVALMAIKVLKRNMYITWSLHFCNIDNKNNNHNRNRSDGNGS